LGIGAGSWTSVRQSQLRLCVVGTDKQTWKCFGGGDFLHFGCHCECSSFGKGRAVKGPGLLGIGALMKGFEQMS
jgi:hypothetical protein